MPKPEAVIFDIGNVLIEWQPERFYDAEVGRARREEMFAAIDLHDMNEQVDRGADFRETVLSTARAHPEFRTEIEMWYERWIEMAQPMIPHSVHLMQQLQARGVPVFSLTNFGVGSYEVARPHYPFLSAFDRDFISGHMQITKPAAQIYQMVEDACGIDPDRLIFTDDRTDNITAAQARGWQTHLFEGPQGWADRLVAEGLLTKAEAAFGT